MARYRHKGSVHVFEKKFSIWPYVLVALIVLGAIGAAADSQAKAGQGAPQEAMSALY